MTGVSRADSAAWIVQDPKRTAICCLIALATASLAWLVPVNAHASAYTSSFASPSELGSRHACSEARTSLVHLDGAPGGRARIHRGKAGLQCLLTPGRSPTVATPAHQLPSRSTVKPNEFLGAPRTQTTIGAIEGATEDLSARGKLGLRFSHTVSDLVSAREDRLAETPGDTSLHLRIGEGVELLAYHIDLTKALVKALLDAQDAPYPQDLIDNPSQREEFVLRLGDMASLAARVDFMAGLMQYLVHNLASSDVPLPEDQEEITLVLNLNGDSSLDISTVLEGRTSRGLGLDIPGFDEPKDKLDIKRVTVKISNGTVTSQAELDPTGLTLQRGQLEVNFDLGTNSITSTTLFTRGEGLKKQVFTVSAQVGSFDLTGQALFASGRQEFELKAYWKGLTFSTLLTPEGLRQPTFGMDLRF